MTKPDFAYTIYIASTPDKVWAALQDPEMTKQFWGRSRNFSDWKVGSRWEHQDYDNSANIDVIGTVIESNPPHRLVLSWASPHAPASSSQVTFDIQPFEDAVRLTVTHGNLDDATSGPVTQGWPAILSSLKSLLETGMSLSPTMRRWKRSA
jgi:uncharacterized protein YndB with AHSA1/START domain